MVTSSPLSFIVGSDLICIIHTASTVHPNQRTTVPKTKTPHSPNTHRVVLPNTLSHEKIITTSPSLDQADTIQPPSFHCTCKQPLSQSPLPRVHTVPLLQSWLPKPEKQNQVDKYVFRTNPLAPLPGSISRHSPLFPLHIITSAIPLFPMPSPRNPIQPTHASLSYGLCFISIIIPRI